MRVILARCWLCQVAVVSAGWCCGCNPKLRPFDDLAYADASRIADNPSARDAILASPALRNFRAHGKASGHIPSRYAVLCRSSSWSAAYEGLMIQEEKVYAFEWVSRRNKGMRSVEIHSAHDHLSMAQDLMDEAGAIRYLPNMVGGSPCILYLYDRGRVRADVAWCFSSDECLLLAQGTHWMWDGGLLAERISIPQGSAEAIEFGKWYIRFAELVGPDLWREQLLAVMRQVASDDPNYRLGSSDDWVMWPAMGIVAAPRLCGALHHQRAAVRSRAAEALGRIGPYAKEAAPALVETMRDKNSDVRRQACAALYELGPAGVPALARSLEAGDSAWRVQVCALLAQVRQLLS